MAARKAPKNGRAWTPEKVRERIRVGLLVSRIEKQALGLNKDFEVYDYPLIKNGRWLKDRKGNPRYEKRVRPKGMTPLQLAAANALLDKCIPKAQDVLEVNGNVTVVFRDPTQRPANLSKARKGRATVPGDV